MYSREYLQSAHKASFANRKSVEESEICGCFYCRKIFTPDQIEEYIEENSGLDDTVQCPFCAIDSVIGSASGYPVTDATFLREMNSLYFCIENTR